VLLFSEAALKNTVGSAFIAMSAATEGKTILQVFLASRMVCGYLMLISIDFCEYIYFFVSSTFLVSIKKFDQELKTMFDHISKHLEVCPNYSARRRLFNSLLSVWKCGQRRHA